MGKRIGCFGGAGRSEYGIGGVQWRPRANSTSDIINITNNAAQFNSYTTSTNKYPAAIGYTIVYTTADADTDTLSNTWPRASTRRS